MKATTITGAIDAPFTDLTRQYSGQSRTEYADGVTAVEYYRLTGDGPADTTYRVLVYDRRYGYKTVYTEAPGGVSGFMWTEYNGEGSGRAGAVARFRNGERADHHARRLMCPPIVF